MAAVIGSSTVLLHFPYAELLGGGSMYFTDQLAYSCSWSTQVSEKEDADTEPIVVAGDILYAGNTLRHDASICFGGANVGAARTAATKPFNGA